MRRALAIQMIIDQEWGLSANENPLQGSYIVDELTDLVEEAVLAEFERISERGGVLGAMETGYQRGRIQDESMLYEQRKHDGSLPIIGVNTFLDRETARPAPATVELARATEEEKRGQLDRLRRLPGRAPRRGRRRRWRRLQGRRDRRGQRVRRADGRRPGLLARADQRRRSSRSAASTGATSEPAAPHALATAGRGGAGGPRAAFPGGPARGSPPRQDRLPRGG